MRPVRRGAFPLGPPRTASALATAFAVLAGIGCHGQLRIEDPPASAPTDVRRDLPPAPMPILVEGRVVCLVEALRDEHGAQTPPVHDHLWAFRRKPGPPRDAEREPRSDLDTLVILRTPLAEGLFVDARLRGRDLILHGRQFAGTGVCEVTSYEGVRDGKPVELYYWCEVCSIKGANPGPCACCQGPVELKEAPRG